MLSYMLKKKEIHHIYKLHSSVMVLGIRYNACAAVQHIVVDSTHIEVSSRERAICYILDYGQIKFRNEHEIYVILGTNIPITLYKCCICKTQFSIPCIFPLLTVFFTNFIITG